MNLNTLLERLKAMPWAQQWRMLSGIGVIVLGALSLLLWGLSPEYAPLYPSLPEKEAGAVMAALEQNGYTYKLDATGHLLVERSKIYEARYKLSTQGLPKQGSEDPLTPPKFGASSTEEQSYQQKIKELELTRSINTLSGISHSRVHLALPRQTLFGKETTPPTASVVLDAFQGLSRAQAAAIAHLVANAVPGLKASDVSIVDSQGKLLRVSDDESSTDTPEQRLAIKEIRLDLQSRIQHLLEPITGVGGSKAEVDVTLEFGHEESVTESWKPNAGVAAVRSQQIVDHASGSPLAAGVPGSSSNTLPLALPPLPNPTPTTASQPSSASKTEPSSGSGSKGSYQSTVNYELDRSVTKNIRKGVKIKRLKAAILVDYKSVKGKDGKAIPTPLSPADLSKIQNLVQESIGLDPDRGDSLQVINMAFVENKPAEPVDLPVWKDPYFIQLALDGGKWLLILIGALWLRSMTKRLFNPDPPQIPEPVEPSLDTPVTATEEPNTVVSVEDSTSKVDINTVKQIAADNPQAVASIIKNWVHGEGGHE